MFHPPNMKVKVETKQERHILYFLVRLVFQAFKHSMYSRKMLSPGERRIIKPIVVLVKKFHCLPNVLVISGYCSCSGVCVP